MELSSHLTSHDQVVNMPVMISATFKPKCSDNFIARTNVKGELISNDFDDYANSDGSHEFLQKTCLRRSHSLGNFEDTERASSGGDVTEDNVVWDCKCAYLDVEKIIDVYPESLEVFEMKFYRHHDYSAEEPLNQSSEPDHQDYLSSLGTNEQTVGDHHNGANGQSSDDVCSREISLSAHPRLSKSRSLSSLGIYNANAIDVILDFESIGFTKSRSAGNLLSMKYKRDLSVVCHESHYSRLQLDMNESEKQQSVFPEAFDEVYALSDSTTGSDEILHQNTDTGYFDEHECNQLAKTEGSPSYANSMQIGFLPNEDGEFHCVPDQERGKEICYEISKEDQSDYGSYCSRYDGEPYSCMPTETDADTEKKLPEKDSFVEYESQLTNKEYSDKRILDWISQIDIQSDHIVEEVGENCQSVFIKHPDKSASLMANKRFEARSIPVMEVAYRYISTLNPSSSSARMANMGLFAIPSLGVFVGLKVLNLSGNSIERITARSLPKGLHALNLSKNNIPGIEGLRELTRLRILDLSHNRISRIGHGLSACSSLRELYLAGNKISEVEGLHRLLKLNILDLNSNKIATSKGLGQLAANYASMQAINLECNPAQKNIGDEQLKKCLLKILPNLVSYNKKAIRTNGSKEVSVNRSTRSQSSHLSDRTLRSEHKRSLRTASSHHRPSLSRAQSGNALTYLLKSSKSRHRRPVPPFVSKQTDEVPKVA